MRFRNFSPQVMDDLWSRWDYAVERILFHFNEEAFCGRGCIRIGSCFSKQYVVLETRNRCLCIFPMQGNLLVFIIFHGHFKTEYLSLDYAAKAFENADLIGFDKLSMTKAERFCATTEDRIRYLESALQYLFGKFWSALAE